MQIPFTHINFDPTPGFNLGITRTFNQDTAAARSGAQISPSGAPYVSGAAIAPRSTAMPTGTGSVLGASTTTPNDLGGGADSAPAAPVDPYSAQQHSFLNALPSALQAIQGNATDAFGTANRTLQSNAEGLFNTLQTGQQGINTARENTELNRLNSIRDILNYVRGGIQQGASHLANVNASDSSASPALALAYSQLGNSQARDAGNQAFLQNRNTDTQQGQLDLQRSQGQLDFQRTRDQLVSDISSQVRQQLSALDQQAQGLSLPDQIAVDQQKQDIVNKGLSSLNGVDQWLQSKLGTISPEDQDAVRRQAAQLQVGGTAGTDPFSLNMPSLTPLQPAGAPTDQLPILVAPGGKKIQ